MNDRLTNYDRYMMERLQGAGNNYCARIESDYSIGSDAPSASSEYRQYLINELRRTEPAEKPVMKPDEYYAYRTGGGVAAVEMQNEAEHTAVSAPKKRRQTHLTKTGKILLIVYVIFMVALASILIVSNTTGTLAYHESANASAIEKNENPNQIRSMSIDEEESGETSWFDRLCDSLNK